MNILTDLIVLILWIIGIAVAFSINIFLGIALLIISLSR